jgi:succinoglycan biosynthesis protein ExoL
LRSVIVYFAADLSDVAVTQRLRMLRAGGAEIRLLGFRRSASPIHSIEGIPAVDLGRTYEGKLAARIPLVLRRCLEARRTAADMMRGADVVLARNLEMMTIANAARGSLPIPLFYECLDIHGAMLGSGIASKLLRSWEKRLLRKSAGLIVSSPGFITNYFDTLGIDLPHTILLENKQVLVDGSVARPSQVFERAPPWKIGWFGIIRCEQSLQILLDLARRRPNLIEIDIRGRPTGRLQALIDQYLPLPNMHFGGAYEHTDLAEMYRKVHFMWAIDYSQRGLNSDWLLPNRIYEAGRHNCPIIALAGTQTSLWLQDHRAGVILDDPTTDLDPFCVDLTPAQYGDLQKSVAMIPSYDLIHTVEHCQRFVAELVDRRTTI